MLTGVRQPLISVWLSDARWYGVGKSSFQLRINEHLTATHWWVVGVHQWAPNLQDLVVGPLKPFLRLAELGSRNSAKRNLFQIGNWFPEFRVRLPNWVLFEEWRPSLTSCHLPLTTCHLPLTTCCLLCTTHCLPRTTYHLPRSTYYLRFTTCYFLFTAFHLPLTTYYLPLTTYYPPLTPHHSPLTTYRSPLTTYHLPLTTYHLPCSTNYLPLTRY